MLYALLLAGCGLFDTTEALQRGPAPVTEDPVQADTQALERAHAATTALQQMLKERLVASMGEGGPTAAVKVCADQAQELTRAVAAEHDVQVGRSSWKLRNPANAGPLWVQAWSHEHQGAKAEGVQELAEVVETPAGRVARVAQPLPTGEVCVACHGAPDQIAPEVRAALAERYPQDQATGFALGDLRGVVWAEALAH